MTRMKRKTMIIQHDRGYKFCVLSMVRVVPTTKLFVKVENLLIVG